MTDKHLCQTMFLAKSITSEYFRNLMEKANPKYQVPSRKHLTSKLIHEKVSNLKESIIGELKSVTNVCLALDLWSNRQMREFLGITGHYITEWQLKFVMLACSRFKGKNTQLRKFYRNMKKLFHLLKLAMKFQTY